MNVLLQRPTAVNFQLALTLWEAIIALATQVMLEMEHFAKILTNALLEFPSVT